MLLASLPPAVGNAHLLLLHLPIGLAVAAVLLEFWTRRDKTGRCLVGKVLAANAGFAVLAAAAGWVLAAQGSYPETTLERHRWAGVACAAVAMLAWGLHTRKGVVAGRIGLVFLAVATTVAGHFGATLTHGEGLLTWSVSPTEKTGVAAGAVSDVHPLLVKHCVECHGPKKQKGRLRLDTVAAAKAEGKSGEVALVPGDPEKSELIRRILLPHDDDEAMPPGDRTPLSPAETSALEAWVKGLRTDK